MPSAAERILGSRPRTTPARLLVGLAILLAASICSVAFMRSLVPFDVHGEVESLGYVDNTGYQLWETEIEGRSWIIDTRVGSRLEVGDAVSKGAWSRTLLVEEEPVTLAPSPEFWRYLAIAGLAVTVVAALMIGTNREGNGR